MKIKTKEKTYKTYRIKKYCCKGMKALLSRETHFVHKNDIEVYFGQSLEVIHYCPYCGEIIQ